MPDRFRSGLFAQPKDNLLKPIFQLGPKMGFIIENP